jgi:hypothetical protein
MNFLGWRAVGWALVTAAVACASLVGVQACSAAGDFQGGFDRFDASPALLPVSTGNDGGITFTSLYADFFGPKGNANCAKNPGKCHGGPSEPGTQSSNGFMCVPDQDGCYKGLIGGGLVVPGSDDPSAGPNALTHHLRHVDPSTGLQSGDMPLAPSGRVFSPAELQRVIDWIDAGAQNN